MTEVVIDCDGTISRITVDDPSMPLLYALTDLLGQKGPRFGCGRAQCGICIVHLDGTPTKSCITPVGAANGRKILTIAGLGTPEKPHPLQTAFIEEQATQCGYCISGWLMTAAALVRENPNATPEQVKNGLAGLKCRCGTHMSIIRAILRVTSAEA